MKNLGIDSSVGIYFRLPNDEIGKKFNSIIADNQYNQKFDKDLKYIKKWIPELETFDYPKPIVEHKEAREKCLRVYKEAVG
jgi:deoxyribodipyrimidine photolyase